jgi:hypothetical protein
MSSVTALELVNRVRLFRRQPTVAAISGPEDTMTLNVINMAIEDVLSTKRWEFDLRHDGALTTRPLVDGASFISVEGSPAGQVTVAAGITDLSVSGDLVMRVWRDGASESPNTSLRVVNSASVTGGVSSILVFGSDLPDSETSDAQLHYSEYILPDTVRDVVRVAYEEENLELMQVDPTVRYDEIFPNANDRTGSPEVVAVGGYDIPTYLAGSDAPDPGLRFAVWPVPDDRYVIRYSYYYRHPELAAANDTLDGVPSAVTNDIVMRAASTMMMAWDQNYAAAHFTDLSEDQVIRKHRAYGGSKSRRHTIGSFESGGNRVQVERGFPDKVLG